MEETKSFYGDLSKLTFPSLVYPKDLAPGNFYPDCICFTIQKRTGVSIDAVTAAASTLIKSASDQFFKNTPEHKKLRKDLEQVEKNLTKNGEIPDVKLIKEGRAAVVDKWNIANPGTQMPQNVFELLGNALKAASTRFAGAQTNALAMQKSGANILGSIYLNMPNGITFNEKANWSGSELGFMGRMSRDFISGGDTPGSTTGAAKGAALGGAGAMVGAAIGAIPSLVTKLGLSGGMLGAGIGALAAGSPLQKGAEAALGVAQNPYMEMMFSGIGFRSFQFEFIMRPTSTDEVKQVAEILKKFRTFTKPTFVQGSLEKSFMDYPMEFQIEFLTSGGYTDFAREPRRGGNENAGDFGANYIPNPFVPKLKNCVCDNVSSNYTPQSIWAAHDEGVPVAVNLSLSFQETELVMAEDVYKKGY